MIELTQISNQEFNTRDQITLNLLRSGQEFLDQFEIPREIILRTVHLVYRYLEDANNIPHNIYKFFTAAYYIVKRHPLKFPDHQPKKEFCRKFGIKASSLEYAEEKIVSSLGIIKILDDKNYPYFINPKSDIGLKMMRSVIKDRVSKQMMDFLLNHQAINSQILTEKLVNQIILNSNIFPEELFRQFYDLIFEYVEKELKQYYEYVSLQKKYFI
ncbi:MAG: hypothetical protein BAJALOKI2v1_10054 [Promethearchaeota archaeon]|nr:MAG: hypothetical protein BAJALOKI2v1_10054 [Candidatus Lokiarchaeota archaeon]